jgi:hypothetical protein
MIFPFHVPFLQLLTHGANFDQTIFTVFSTKEVVSSSQRISREGCWNMVDLKCWLAALRRISG